MPESVWAAKTVMTKEVQQTIETADILLGAERMIADYSAKIEKDPTTWLSRFCPIWKKLQENGLTGTAKIPFG